MEENVVKRITRQEVLDDMVKIYRMAMDDLEVNGVVIATEKGAVMTNPAFTAVSKVVATLIKMEAIDVKKTEQIKALNFSLNQREQRVLDIAQ